MIVRLYDCGVVGLSGHHNINYYVSASIDNISLARCDNRSIDCPHCPMAALAYSAVNNPDCVIAVPVGVAPTRDSLGGCMLHVGVLPGQGCAIEFLHLGKRGEHGMDFSLW